MRCTWEAISQSVRPWLPFTALNTIWRHLDRRARPVLDVGCGKGGPMAFLRRRLLLWAVGVDIFEPYVRECRRRGSHDDLVLGDAHFLPFRPNSFDVVLCIEVLEHLDKEDGMALLAEMEEIARLQVIISIPIGRHEQHEYDGNPYHEHRYIWEPQELQRLGYTVYGHGIRGLGGLSGIQSSLSHSLRPLVDFLWVAAGPLVHWAPRWARNMVAIRRLSHSGRTEEVYRG